MDGCYCFNCGGWVDEDSGYEGTIIGTRFTKEVAIFCCKECYEDWLAQH